MNAETSKSVDRTQIQETPPAFLTQSEAAKLIRLSERSLERLRLTGTGPVFVKLGRRVLYKRHDLETWVTANTFHSTSEVARAAQAT